MDKVVRTVAPAAVTGGRSRSPSSSGPQIQQLDIYNNLEEEYNQVVKGRTSIKGENCTFNLQASSLFLFSPDSSMRRKCFMLVDHKYFERIVLITIFLNCITLILATPVIVDQPGIATTVFVGEIVFQVLFTIEMLLKVVALGFVGHDHAYLRSGWNQVDFVIVVLGFVGFFAGSNFSAIRVFRVLKPLKAVSKVPELSALVSALMSSVPRMRDVMLLMSFMLLMFSILGLQLYVGTQHQRCYIWYNHSSVDPSTNLTTYSWQPQLIPQDTNWCSKDQGVGHQCPIGSSCEVHKSIFHEAVLNFDNIGNSILYIFKIVSLDNWPSDLWRIQSVAGTWNFVFVFVVVLFGSFFCVNLILAILSSEYNTASEEAARKHEQDLLLDDDYSDDDDEEVEMEMPPTIIAPAVALDAHPTVTVTPDTSPDVLHHDLTEGTYRPSVSFTEDGEVPNSLMASMEMSERRISTASNMSHNRKRRRRKKSVLVPTDGKNTCWQGFRAGVLVFVSHRFFVRFMFLITILNVVVLAIDHHPINPTLEIVLNWVNFGCSLIFIVEFLLKFTGEGVKYFKDGFNRFDCMLVAVSIPEMAVSGGGSGSAFSALRAFRLARVFRVVKASKTIRRLLVTVFKASASAAYLFLLLILFILVTALVGVNLMEKAYQPGVRPNFSNLGDGLLAVFIVITGENWMEVTELGMEGSNAAMVLYFLILFCFGNFIILNLFVAILIDSFGNNDSEEDAQETEARRETFVVEAFKHSTRPSTVLVEKHSDALVPTHPTATESPQSHLEQDQDEALRQASSMMFIPSDQAGSRQHSGVTYDDEGDIIEMVVPMSRPTDIAGSSTAEFTGDNSDDFAALRAAGPSQAFSAVSLNSGILDLKHKKTRHTLTFSEALANVFGKRKRILCDADFDENDNVREGAMASKSTIGSPLTSAEQDELLAEEDVIRLRGKSFCVLKADNPLRVLCARTVTHPYFELTIVILIAASCIMLGFDNPTSRENSRTKKALFVTDVIFLVLFFFEALTHCIAWGVFYGEDTYLTNPWNRLDAVVVVASFVGVFGIPYVGMLRSLRVFKLAARAESLRVVITATFKALPNIANVVILVLFGFIVFGILGVQLFKGAFVYCNDESIVRRVDCVGTYQVISENSLINNSQLITTSTNLTMNRAWKYPYFHFNNLGSALVTLVALSLSDGWSVVLWQAVDSQSYDEAMAPYNRPWMALYVLVFVIFGCFFMMNLFIGSLIDSFSHERDKKEGRVDDDGAPLISADQAEWLRAYRVARSATLESCVPRAQNCFRAFCCRVYFTNEDNKVPNVKFEYVITTCIVVNTLIMCLQFDGMPDDMHTALWWINLFFAVIYTIEFGIKITALLPPAYFRDGWNRFDFVLIPTAYIAAFVGGPGTNALRVLRVARVIRLIKRAEGLQRLFNSLLYAIPQLINITMLLLMTIFIFGVIGVDLFAKVALNDVEPTSILNEFFNFKHAGLAMVTLFQISTTESWWDVMRSCMIDEDNSSCQDGENCGSWIAIPYFILFMIAANCVCINLFIFVIVDNYLEVQRLSNDKSALVLRTIEAFRDAWLGLDTGATKEMHWEVMLGILKRLPEESGFQSETEFGFLKYMRGMNIPIDEKFQVGYTDCIRGLTRHFYGLNELDTLKIVKMISVHEAIADHQSFKVHHAIVARIIVRNWRAKKKEEALGRSVLNRLKHVLTLKKASRPSSKSSSLRRGSGTSPIVVSSPRPGESGGGSSSPGLSLQLQESSGNFLPPWEGRSERDTASHSERDNATDELDATPNHSSCGSPQPRSSSKGGNLDDNEPSPNST